MWVRKSVWMASQAIRPTRLIYSNIKINQPILGYRAIHKGSKDIPKDLNESKIEKIEYEENDDNQRKLDFELNKKKTKEKQSRLKEAKILKKNKSVGHNNLTGKGEVEDVNQDEKSIFLDSLQEEPELDPIVDSEEFQKAASKDKIKVIFRKHDDGKTIESVEATSESVLAGRASNINDDDIVVDLDPVTLDTAGLDSENATAMMKQQEMEDKQNSVLSANERQKLETSRDKYTRLLPISTPKHERQHSQAFTNPQHLIDFLFKAPHEPVHHTQNSKSGYSPDDVDSKKAGTKKSNKPLGKIPASNLMNAASKNLELGDHPEFVPHNIYSSITLDTLMHANLHLGSSSISKKMSQFIYGMRRGISIINLEHTLTYLRRALRVAKQVSYYGGKVVFVGQRPAIHRIVAEAARRSDSYFVTEWKRGTIRNREMVLHRSVGFNPGESVHTKKSTLRDLLTMSSMKSNAKFDSIDSIEEINEILEIKRLELLDSKKVKHVHTPDLIIVLDMKNARDIIWEANLENIPIISLCDTDCDPTVVTYPIPGNDDSIFAVKAIAGALSLAVREGKLERDRTFKFLKENSKEKKDMFSNSSAMNKPYNKQQKRN